MFHPVYPETVVPSALRYLELSFRPPDIVNRAVTDQADHVSHADFVCALLAEPDPMVPVPFRLRGGQRKCVYYCST
jgi:hypothetical protein